MESVDLAWAVMAIRIQREVGGNLAELLDTVAATMVERERLRQEVLALTAEARLSAWVLGVFPLGCGVVLSVAQPAYMATLFGSPIGVLALGVSLVMAVVGFVWLRRIMTIEV
jgi:tight adherence protein B